MLFTHHASSSGQRSLSWLLLFARTFLMFFVLMSFFGCLGTSNDEETGESAIHLKGKVVNEANLPMAGVVAKLSSNSLSDTTDMYGVYELIKDKDESINKGAKGEVIDTLVFMTNDQVSQVLPIENYVDTNLPIIKIVQRDIRGQARLKGTMVKDVWAVLLKGEGASTTKITTEIWFNQENGKFNGFLYFPYSNNKRPYRVYVYLRGSDGKLLAISDTLSFTDLAGDLDIEPFDSDNAFPQLSIVADSVAHVGQSLVLSPIVEDQFGGEITRLEWDIGNTGAFIVASGNDTTIQLPNDTTQSYICALRATDNENNVSIAQHSIRLIINNPVAKLKIPGKVRCDSSYKIDWSESQSGELGEGLKKELKIGLSGEFLEVSGSDTIVKSPSVSQTNYPIVLRITDIFGNQVADTQTIDFHKSWDKLKVYSFREDNSNIDFDSYPDGLSVGVSKYDSEYNLRLVEYSIYQNDQWTKLSIPTFNDGSNNFAPDYIYQQGDAIYSSRSSCDSVPDSVREPPEGLENVMVISDEILDSTLYLWRLEFKKYQNDDWQSQKTFHIFGEFSCNNYSENLIEVKQFSLTSNGIPYIWNRHMIMDSVGERYLTKLRIFQNTGWEDIPLPSYVDTTKESYLYHGPNNALYLIYHTSTGCYGMAKYQNNQWTKSPELRVDNNCVSSFPNIQFLNDNAFILDVESNGVSKMLTLDSSNQWQTLYDSNTPVYSTHPVYLEADGSLYIVITSGSKPNMQSGLFRVNGENIEEMGDRRFPMDGNVYYRFFRNGPNQWRAAGWNNSTGELTIYELK